LVVFAGLLALAGGAACGGSDKSPAAPPGNTNKLVDVYTIEESFVANYVTISPGDTIRWNFNKAQDGLGHNVRFDSLPKPPGVPADIGTQKNPMTTGTASRVFTTRGDFNYVCDLHGAMMGEIVVQ
jgi:plastocyanin